MSDRNPRAHLSLRVRPERVPALIDFYAQLFGVRPAKQHEDHVQFDLVDPPLNLSFVPTARSVTGEVDHLGIQVFSAAALDGYRARVAALPRREEPGVACCYARQDKFWLIDPEGREVEVFFKLEDLDVHGLQRPATAEPASPATCCGPDGCATA
jgi:hypothetical protein